MPKHTGRLNSSETNKVTIAVIPAFNEEKRIVSVIEATLKYVDALIVVNDCSKDNTSLVAKTTNATVVDLPVNKGQGYATRVGCDLAISKGADIIITIDADGQHDPEDIPRLLEALINENLDIVFGSRPRNENMPAINKLGGRILYGLSQILFRLNIEDTLTGFHVFTKTSYQKLRWSSNRYQVPSEIVYKVYLHQLSYKEVPVKTIYHGKKGMRKRDGLQSIVMMLLWKFKFYYPLRKALQLLSGKEKIQE